MGKSSVYRIIDNLRAFGSHTAPAPATATATTKRGRPCAISPAARIGLRAFVEGRPGARQDEMRCALLDSFDLAVSQPTISNTLRAMKIGRKRGRREVGGVSASRSKRDLSEESGREGDLITGLCENSP